jgi:hypothetical protein
MARSSDEKGADKAAALRRSQQRERTQLLNTIAESQKRISSLNEEKAPISADLRKVEAEVGPIKYVAEMIYGSSSPELLDKAVRWVIIMIIFVFDPLAILLLIAANMEMKKNEKTFGNPFKEPTDDRIDIASGEDVIMINKRNIMPFDD